MANFTMTLTEARENNPAEDFGLSSYPIFDETYRPVLNAKIFDRYANREIGSSTIQEFRLWMRRRMNEIMPFYNQLYLSQKMQIDPLNTVSMETFVDGEMSALSKGDSENTGKSTGNSVQSTNADSRSRTVDYATPQNALAGKADYATAAQDSSSKTNGGSDATNTENSESTSASKAESTSNTSTQSKTVGYSGSQAVLLNEYRKTFLNIDVDIIEDLSDLFMRVWTNGSSYTQPERGYPYVAGYWF